MSRRSSFSGSLSSLAIDGLWPDVLSRAVAELIGSAIFVYIGCMGCVGSFSGPGSNLQISLTFGFAITAIVHIIGHMSDCHINPMVSVSSVILGTKSPATAAIYMTAHFFGAIIGYGMLRVVTPLELLHNGNPETVNSFCVTSVNEKISLIQGLMVEIFATGILILFVCASADHRNNKNSESKAIKYGLLISTLTMASRPYTGCGMNPARSFAPALWNNEWTLHWVYWLGPIAGTVMASCAYRILFWAKESPTEVIADSDVLKSIEIERSEAVTAHALANGVVGDRKENRDTVIPTISNGLIHHCPSYGSR